MAAGRDDFNGVEKGGDTIEQFERGPTGRAELSKILCAIGACIASTRMVCPNPIFSLYPVCSVGKRGGQQALSVEVCEPTGVIKVEVGEHNIRDAIRVDPRSTNGSPQADIMWVQVLYCIDATLFIRPFIPHPSVDKDAAIIHLE